MPTIYGAVDLVKNELRNAVVQNLGSAPASPVKGLLYFNSADNTLYWYDGTTWVAAKSAGALSPASTVTTQAVGDAPVVGTLTNFAREDHKHGMPAFGGTVAAETTFNIASSVGAAATIARSDHTHGSPVHDGGAHSTIPLNAIGVPTGAVSMNNQKLTNLAAPTVGSDAANKTYVDSAINGLSWKDTCRVASTANVVIATGGLIAVDGVTVAVGDRVLLKNQTTASQNGIYVAASGAWTRSTDAAAPADILQAAVFVSEGTTQSDTAWVMTTNSPITIDSTNLTWVQFGAPASYVGGAGLTLTGNTFDVGAGTGITVAADTVAVDTTVIATRAYVDGGIGTTALITAGNGLTKTGQTVDVVGGTGITVAADLVSVDTTVIATQSYVTTAITGMAKKFAAALTGTASPETVTHNLNTRDVQVTVLNGASPYTAVEVDWDATTVNTVTVRYNPTLGAGYRCVVVG